MMDNEKEFAGKKKIFAYEDRNNILEVCKTTVNLRISMIGLLITESAENFIDLLYDISKRGSSTSIKLDGEDIVIDSDVKSINIKEERWYTYIPRKEVETINIIPAENVYYVIMKYSTYGEPRDCVKICKTRDDVLYEIQKHIYLGKLKENFYEALNKALRDD